jgi:SAM-dependent methyltransferase/DNA-binding MarR family transcriptional regulator
MDGVQLYLLGQELMRIGEQTLPEESGLRRLPSSVRLVLADLAQHPGTSVGAIAKRTGLPRDLVHASVSRLADKDFLETAVDPAGSQPVIIKLDPSFQEAGPADTALAVALGASDPGQVGEIAASLESLALRLGVGRVLYSPEHFDAAYKGTPPWETGRPQSGFAQLAEAGAIRGRILDVGCGTGENVLMAAGLGLSALGIDTSSVAIEISERKARERELPARFAVHDALDLKALAEQFDTVLDSGLFHIFSDRDRSRYANSLRDVVPLGGRVFLLCLSDRQQRGFGPRRITQEEIKSTFADGWRVDAIDPVTLDMTVDPDGMRAWRAAITRT